MSSDNGIYILVSPELDGGFFTGKNEYRVAHAMAIDNINIGGAKTVNTSEKAYGKEIDLGLLYEVLIFANSKVFKEKTIALEHAKILQKEEYYTEYGINFIYRNHPFVDNITVEEAQSMIKNYFEALS